MSDDLEETTETEPELELLDDLGLPDHHGRKPKGMHTKFRGFGVRLLTAHSLGDQVSFYVTGVVKDVGHKDLKKEGLTYIEAVSVEEAFEFDMDAAYAIETGLRQKYRMADDRRMNRRPLIDEPEAARMVIAWQDESGYMLDAADMARIQGKAPEVDDESLAAAEASAVESEAAEDHAATLDALSRVADGDCDAYDRLGVEQIVGVLGDVDDDSTLAACEEHELAGKTRKGVLKGLRARADEMEAAGREDGGD